MKFSLALSVLAVFGVVSADSSALPSPNADVEAYTSFFALDPSEVAAGIQSFVSAHGPGVVNYLNSIEAGLGDQWASDATAAANIASTATGAAFASAVATQGVPTTAAAASA